MGSVHISTDREQSQPLNTDASRRAPGAFFDKFAGAFTAHQRTKVDHLSHTSNLHPPSETPRSHQKSPAKREVHSESDQAQDPLAFLQVSLYHPHPLSRCLLALSRCRHHHLFLSMHLQLHPPFSPNLHDLQTEPNLLMGKD